MMSVPEPKAAFGRVPCQVKSANFRLMHCAEWRVQLGRGRVKTLAFSHAAQQELQGRKEREVLRAQEALARQSRR